MKEANVVSSSPTEEEKHQLRKLLENHPNFVFQQRNKLMNQDGFMMSICTISEGAATAQSITATAALYQKKVINPYEPIAMTGQQPE